MIPIPFDVIRFVSRWAYCEEITALFDGRVQYTMTVVAPDDETRTLEVQP